MNHKLLAFILISSSIKNISVHKIFTPSWPHLFDHFLENVEVSILLKISGHLSRKDKDRLCSPVSGVSVGPEGTAEVVQTGDRTLAASWRS
jgi:hypothetical protein